MNHDNDNHDNHDHGCDRGDMMSQHFNNRAIYDEQIQPLLSKIHAIATEHGIPFISATCTKKSADGYGISMAVNLTGPETTPLEMAMAKRLMETNHSGEVLQLMSILLATSPKVVMLGDDQPDPDHDDVRIDEVMVSMMNRPGFTRRH